MSTLFAKPINNIATTVAAPYTAGSGSLSLASAAGITLAGGQYIRVSTFRAGTPLSILKATAVVGNVLTVSLSGALEGTSDVNLIVGDAAELRITAGALSDLATAVNALETSIVGATVAGNIPGNAAGLTAPIAEAQVTGLVADLALKAPLASPALTGIPTAPTATVGTNTTQVASTAFVIANAGAGGTPGGSTKSVQYDNAGAFAGDSNLTWDSAAKKLTLGGTIALDSNINVFRIYAGGQRLDYNENPGVGLDINNLAGNIRWYSGAGAITFRTKTLVGNEQATTDVALTVMGVASQSADLTDWKNSSGTVLASIDSAGNLTTIRSVPYSWPAAQGGAATYLKNDGAGVLSWAGVAGAGTVTSVGLALPAFLTVSGSPVTAAGTLTAVLATQAANVVLAGPTSGGAAAPTFRALVAADLPATYLTANQAITLSGDASGTGTTAITVALATVPIAKGGTGQTAALAAYDALAPTTTLGDLTVRNTSGSSRLAGNTTATKQFLAQTGTGSLSALPAWGAIAAADLPTTGLVVNAHSGAITTDTDGATITFNCATTDWHQVQLGGNRTLALSGDVDGQQFSVILQQDGTGSRTVTWWAGILWPGGTVPTLTTAASKRDVFTFKRLSSGVYLGFAPGLNS